MQVPTVSPVKVDSPPFSRSPSPCSTSTPRIRSESKKRPIEDDYIYDADTPDTNEQLDNELLPVQQKKEKQRKFFTSRDQTDRESEKYENISKTASLMFDELQHGKKGKPDGSPEGVKREPLFSPKTYKQKAAGSSLSRLGISPNLNGKPNIISKNTTQASSFYGGSVSTKYFSEPNRSPYFPSGKTYGINRLGVSHPGHANRLGVPHPGHAKRSALATLHYNTSQSPVKKLGLSSKDVYSFKDDENNETNHRTSPAKAGDFSPEKQYEELDDNEPKIIPAFEIGFRNLGNTCYINSTIQILLGLEPFCLDVEAEPGLKSSHLPALQALIKYSKAGQQKIAMGALEILRERFIKGIDSSFSGHKQQDASEFLSKLLDRISDEINDTNRIYFSSFYKESSKNFIEDNFEILMEEKNSCKDCEKIREEKQKDRQLFLSFPTEEIEKGDEDSLFDLIEYTEKKMSIQSLVEQVLGRHSIKCVGCDSENGLRVVKLTSLPRILLVQLKRYNNQSEKICNPAQISPYIELDKLVTDDCASPKPTRYLRQNVGVQTMDKEECDKEDDDYEKCLKLSLEDQQQDLDIKEALRRSLLEESNTENWSKDEVAHVWSRPLNAKHAYRLVGIVLHVGQGIKQGHYTANVYRHDVKKWMYYNDRESSEVETNELLGSKNQKNCYLLAYMHQDIFEAMEKASELNKTNT